MLTDPELTTSALLGISIAANNDKVAVGMPGVNTSTGDVLVFDRHSGEMLHGLLPADAPTDNFFFGRSIDMDGNTLVVGTGGYYGEAAYVFDVNSGELLQKLTRPATATAQFGNEVAIEGNLALVSDRDTAYLFNIQTADVLRTFRAGGSAYYGSRVALDQNYAYISLPDDSAVFQFDLLTGKQVRRIRGNDTHSGNLFGEHLALDQGRLLVGAINASAAYLFDVATGAQLHKYQGPGAMRFDHFGTSVDLSGDLVLVGASNTSIDGVFDVGAAYLFDASSGDLLAKLRLNELEFNNGFGRSVELEGSSLIVSAPGLYDFAGAVFVFEVPEQSAAQLFCIGAAFLVFATPPRRVS